KQPKPSARMTARARPRTENRASRKFDPSMKLPPAPIPSGAGHAPPVFGDMMHAFGRGGPDGKSLFGARQAWVVIHVAFSSRALLDRFGRIWQGRRTGSDGNNGAPGKDPHPVTSHVVDALGPGPPGKYSRPSGRSSS